MCIVPHRLWLDSKPSDRVVRSLPSSPSQSPAEDISRADARLLDSYIVEAYGEYNPCSSASGRGTVTYDGATYTLCESTRVNQPSIDGTATFQQFWAVRQSRRTSGTVDTGFFFNAWSSKNMRLGSNHYYMIMATEAYRSAGSSTVTVGSGGGGTTPPPTDPGTGNPPTNPTVSSFSSSYSRTTAGCRGCLLTSCHSALPNGASVVGAVGRERPAASLGAHARPRTSGTRSVSSRAFARVEVVGRVLSMDSMTFRKEVTDH